MNDNRPILLVEDNALDLELMLSAIGRLDLVHQVDIARDGEQALEYLSEAAREGRCPALTMLDLKLPRASGLEILRYSRGRGEFCQMPIVVISTSQLDEDVQAAYQLGANAYVPKPMSFSDLLEATAATLEFWLNHNLPPPEGACGHA